MQTLIEENMRKMEKKREKEGLPAQKITSQAHLNVKNIDKKGNTDTEKEKKIEESYKTAPHANPGRLAAKANLVREFDERNKKKK